MSIRGRKSLSNRQDEFRKSATKILESNKYVFERQKMLFYSAVSEQVLLLVCRDLTPKDYDVVVVERNSENLCGFPICGLSLEGTKGKVLGLKIKEKVYGLTGRKSFCSHRCFSESLYLQNQLCEEPLYARSRNSNVVLSLPRTRAPNPGRNSSTTQEEDTDIRTLLTSIPEHDSESDELKAGAPDRERDGGYPVDKRPVVAGASHFIEGAPVKSKYRGSRPDGEPECSQQKEPGKVRTDGEDFSNAASKESEFSDDEFDVLRPSREKLGDYELTLFGRIWNTLSSSITNKTINYLTDLQESLPSASEKDIDSCLEARDIFYRQILTGINNILRRNCIELSLSDDIIALLDTLTIKQASGLVLSEIDRNCISSVLLRCLADKIKSVGTALNRKESLDSPTVWENIISSSGIDQLQMELMVQLFKRTF